MVEKKEQMQENVFLRQPVEDFFNYTHYSGTEVNHDNTAVLVTHNQNGVFNLFRYPINGDQAIQLTFSNCEHLSGISWFPEDDRILFTSDDSGNELNHIYVRKIDGTHVDLTPGKQIKAEFLCWLKDNSGFWIATNERDKRYFDIYRYSTTDYRRELVFVNNQEWLIETISPDGFWACLKRKRSNSSADLYLVNLKSAKKIPQLITSRNSSAMHFCFTFTPDSNHLIYATDEFSEYKQAWKLNLNNGKTTLFYQANWDINFVTYSNDAQYRLVGINKDGAKVVDILNSSTGKSLNRVSSYLNNWQVEKASFSKDSHYIVFQLHSDTQPTRIVGYDIEQTLFFNICADSGFVIPEKTLVASKIIRFNSFDNLQIPANLYKPKLANPCHKTPALIWIHGGPGGQFCHGYKAELQNLVNHGYAILAVNNRGSSGYGKTFFHLDDKKHGDVDLQDIVFAKKYLQTLDWVDEQQIGVIGTSYGGYLSLAAMAFTNEFQVGIDIFGVTNWNRALTRMPSWWESTRKSLYDEMGDPEVDFARHRAISPLFHADKITRPILIVQGANDPRVLQEESDDMVAAIEANQIPVVYLLFSDEGHGFKKTANRITAAKAYLKFLDDYL